MNKRTLILIAIGLLVVVPIVLNFFVRINSCIPTIGDERDWLAFFGSYWGGVFSCIVAFIAVYRQFKQGVQDMQIRDQEQKIEHLSQDLSNCIGSFNFSQIGAISLFTNETNVYDYIDSELTKLNTEQQKIVRQGNIWGLIYGQSTEQHIKEFNNLYLDCIGKFQDDVNTMTLALAELRKTKDHPDFFKKVTCLNRILNEHQDTVVHPLFNSAQHVIDQENKVLSQLQAKRKKF